MDDDLFDALFALCAAIIAIAFLFISLASFSEEEAHFRQQEQVIEEGTMQHMFEMARARGDEIFW